MRGLKSGAGAWVAALVLALALAAAGGARAAITVSFYSHGWGVGPHGFIYFPHAFVVIERSGEAGAGEETYGFTAVGQDPSVLMHPTPGEVIPEDPVYLKKSTLHFTVEATEAQYQALKARVAAWAAPGSPLYDLNGHNCITFVAELAATLGLQIPPPIGRDPGKFLEGVRQLNLGRLTSVAAATPGGPGG